LTDAVELNRLTNVLDHELCRALFDQLGVTDTITVQQYAAAYRLCNNEAIRVRQIDLTTHVLQAVGAGARLRVVGMGMKMVRGPAQRAGWIELYDFLERGYDAFRQIQDTAAFVGTIAQRERQILDLIIANDTRLLLQPE
jgi:site-specific recombinase XerC